jgi:hypothetical protein
LLPSSQITNGWEGLELLTFSSYSCILSPHKFCHISGWVYPSLSPALLVPGFLVKKEKVYQTSRLFSSSCSHLIPIFPFPQETKAHRSSERANEKQSWGLFEQKLN